MSAFITLNDLRYHLWRIGDGTPLLLLHGFTGTAQTWKPIAPTLSATYRLIAPDLIGHGKTDAPATPSRYNVDHAARDLITLLDHWQIEQVHLLGYSMGGRLALYTAVHYPQRIRTLTLESSSSGLKHTTERSARQASDMALADKIEHDGIAAFVDFWQALPLWKSQHITLDAAAQARLRAERLSQRPQGLANSLRGMGTGVQPSLWDTLPSLHLPVQLIAGALDEKFCAINRAMQAKLPDARLSIIPDAGHTPHLENPATFTQTLLSFLKP